MDDNPLVDGSAEREYVFYNDVHVGSAYDDQIVEYNYVASPPSTMIATVNVGNSQRDAGTGFCGETAYFFSGNFDNVYFQSSNDTGNLWVVGNSIGPSHLYSVAITNNVMGTATSQATLSNASPFGYGSPVTEFCNNGTNACASNGTKTTAGTDYLFFSVYQGLPSPCINSGGHGCVMSYNITTPSAPTLAGALDELAPNTGVPLNPTGAIVIDNALASPTGTSNIYFSTRKTNGTCSSGPTGICAVQASQVP